MGAYVNSLPVLALSGSNRNSPSVTQQVISQALAGEISAIVSSC